MSNEETKRKIRSILGKDNDDALTPFQESFYEKMTHLMLGELGPEKIVSMNLALAQDNHLVLTEKGCGFCDETFGATLLNLCFEKPEKFNLGKGLCFADDIVAPKEKDRLIDRGDDFFVHVRAQEELKKRYTGLKAKDAVTTLLDLGHCLSLIEEKEGLEIDGYCLQAKKDIDDFRPMMSKDAKTNAYWQGYRILKKALKRNKENEELRDGVEDCLLQLTRIKDAETSYAAYTKLGALYSDSNREKAATEAYKQAWLALPKKDERRDEAYDRYFEAAKNAGLGKKEIFSKDASKKDVRSFKALTPLTR